ncbi:MAG: adenosine deaminase [Opitutus sp.]|nr:adenosine deaminase [Opitutus sp.]
MNHALLSYLRALPKVELHNHLEGGSMYPELALELARANGMTLPFHDAASAEKFYQFTSLDQFIGILRTTVATLNTASDYARAVERHGQLAASQNIRYHELFVTYGLVSRRGVKWEAIAEGLAEGIRINREKHGVDTAFIVDLDRTLDPETAVQHVELAARDRERCHVVGIGLDCQERGYPAGRLKAAFDRARELGFRLTAHAGEDGGPESVGRTPHLRCRAHRARRAGHPRSKLVAYLAEKRIPLTVCPVSNILLRVYPKMEDHSFRRLLDAGVRLTVNSDDPPMFATDMVNDLVQVADTFALTVDELTQIVRTAFEVAFWTPERRDAELQIFDLTAAKLRAQLGL